MANRVQIVGHSGGDALTFLGRVREITVDLGNQSLRVHDGINAGGTELARADLENVLVATAGNNGKMSAAQATQLVTVIAGLAQEIIDRVADVDAEETRALAAEATKANLAIPVTAGNIALLNVNGDLEDSIIAFSSDGIYADNLPSGIPMLFQTTLAPVGWTKQITHNDKALRVVSGAAADGGSVNFSTVFSREATDAHTLSTAQLPAHTHGSVGNHSHSVNRATILSGGSTSILSGVTEADGWTADITTGAAGSHTHTSVGGGASHTHNMDIRVQYVDLIIATKD